jgi:hypothetical protein
MPSDHSVSGEPITPAQLMDNLAVRKYVGRKIRDDHRALTREALQRYRTSHGFPAPLKTPGVQAELWRRRDVEAWVKSRGRMT